MELSGSLPSGGELRRVRTEVRNSRDSSESIFNLKTTAAHHVELAEFYDAVKLGNRDKVRMILDKHPEFLDCKDVQQNDALHLAVLTDKIEIVQLLAERSKSTSRLSFY